MSRKISQREARRLKRLVGSMLEERKRERNDFAAEYPGVHIASLQSERVAELVRLARKLGHAVVVTVYAHEIQLYAVELQS